MNIDLPEPSTPDYVTWDLKKLRDAYQTLSASMIYITELEGRLEVLARFAEVVRSLSDDK